MVQNEKRLLLIHLLFSPRQPAGCCRCYSQVRKALPQAQELMDQCAGMIYWKGFCCTISVRFVGGLARWSVALSILSNVLGRTIEGVREEASSNAAKSLMLGEALFFTSSRSCLNLKQKELSWVHLWLLWKVMLRLVLCRWYPNFHICPWMFWFLKQNS